MAIDKIIQEDIKVMSCLITFGTADPKNEFVINNPRYIREVVDISINDTYRTLINSATVKIAKGTLFETSVISDVTFEGGDSSRAVPILPSNDDIHFDMERDGTIVQKTVYQTVVSNTTISIRDRIKIEIGYNGELKTMFEGYVTKITTGSVLELGCENMAYILKLKNAPNIKVPKESAFIHDICGEKYGLLKGTGFTLHPDVARERIQVGALELVDDFTIADLFNHWAQSKIYAFLKYDNRDNTGMPKITFVRPYSSANRPEGVNPLDAAYPIYFDYNVASENLVYNIVDPLFVAVQGTGLQNDGKFFSLILRRNPEYNANNSSSKKYQVVNKKETSKKKEKKLKRKKDKEEESGSSSNDKKTGKVTGGERFMKSDLSKYTVIPYVSKKIGITLKELEDECITWLETYQINGIEGSLTIFGDYGLSSGVHVSLIDKREADKNGLYIVDEVTTDFSASGGYRQSLKIPYRVKKLDGGETK